MRLLLNTALKSRQTTYLLICTVLLMCLTTFASQLEIFSIGIITKSGPGFFELFGSSEVPSESLRSEKISKEEVLKKWEFIEDKNDGYITLDSANHYIAEKKGGDIISKGISTIDRFFPVTKNLKNLVYLLIFVALFKAISLFSYRFITRLVAIYVSRDLRLQYFEHIQSLPISFFYKYNSGSLSSRVVGDAALIAEAINACLVNYLQTPFVVMTTLTLCFLTSWQLSLIIFVGFPFIILPIVFLAKRVKRISKQIQQNQERFTSVLLDFLAGVQTVKVFAMEAFSLKKYQEYNERMASLEKRSARYDLSSRPIVHTVGMFCLATALMYGIYILQMSNSEVFFYCGLLYIFYEPIKKFAEENSHIQRGIAAAERLYEVMEMKPDIEDDQNSLDLLEFNESIEFDDVWFRYGESWVLKGVSFTISKGECVAIVGPTGSGKSTIVQLLPRLYDIQKGEIRVDGTPLKEYTQRSLREMIAFVPQKPFLFVDTVANNISFGRPFSKEQIEEAASAAYADEFIETLPQGYETELAEAGKNLSGGQQQRLAIARALVKGAPILVMDEATSSLDALSEERIKQSIDGLRGQMTQIIIAHRLSTIEKADRIIYIERGKKIAEGTKEELLASCPAFERMWNCTSEVYDEVVVADSL
ncbi:MAG: ABC transporter ATP-binding protein [Parachlamydiaceae bacterium]|nr:ABC transporter ATP-binding protein [Parachlamydiaceae bacterium]